MHLPSYLPPPLLTSHPPPISLYPTKSRQSVLSERSSISTRVFHFPTRHACEVVNDFQDDGCEACVKVSEMILSPTQAVSLEDFLSNQQDVFTGIKLRSRRPCDSCRRRKSRCEVTDGLPCVLCRFHRQECTFIEEPQPRKRRAIAVDIEEDVVDRDAAHRSASRKRKESPSGSPNAPRIQQEPSVDDYANFKGPSLLKETLGLQKYRHSRLIGSTSEYEQVLIETGINHGGDIPIGVSALRKVNDAAFILYSDASTRSHDHEITDLDAIETLVAPHGQALIHLYFRIVHPSFPVLHKKVFLEKYRRTHREFSPPLLAAVYILALNWWTYSSDLALLPKPDVSRLEALAFSTINDAIHRPKLSTLQAGLLLLQSPGSHSWALTTQLTGLGQDLGLHLDCSSWSIPAWERGLRKRLAWALYMQDKWGSLMHGRPSHFTPADWDVRPLEESDFPENAADEDHEDGSTEVEQGRMLFCEMIKLTEILGSVLSNFYTLKAEKELYARANEGVRWVLEKAKPIQLSLRQWYSELPASLRMESIASRKLSSTGKLAMTIIMCMLKHCHQMDSANSKSNPFSNQQYLTLCRLLASWLLRCRNYTTQAYSPDPVIGG
jgi:hypothetical protein